MPKPLLTAITVFVAAFMLITSTALGQDTGTENGTGDKLFERLAAAKTEAEGRKIEYEIWEYWTAQAPTEEIGAKLKRGMEKRREADLLWAEDLFDEVIREAPDYAEGWNQRAFARFLKGNSEGALTDLEKAVELEPRHFGAMAGMYHILFSMNRTKAAYAILARAVEIHPWLKERNALPENMQPAGPGESEKL